VANLASAKKRIRQDEKRRLRAKGIKSRVKTEVKKLLEAIHDGKIEDATKQYGLTAKILDQTAAKGTMHAKTASRRKSRLAKRLAAAKAAAAA
jgi:small subunit ribosomal protein S20